MHEYSHIYMYSYIVYVHVCTHTQTHTHYSDTSVKHFDHTLLKVFRKSLRDIWIQIYFIKFQNCHDTNSTVMPLSKRQKLLDLSLHETMPRSFKEHEATCNVTETNTNSK